ncbi:MAG: aminoglycoside phosphotransferase family protein [Kineosporiaceae bacterium]|nr:aminoglycoside phosphotransferase family protein [Kineosporiaceae bacterium]
MSPAGEQPLPGGLGSDGLVVRVGDTVRRPEREYSAAVRAFLNHLHANGFDAAPRPLGHDELGREILTYLPGQVAHPPFPAWAGEESLLISVASLQRRLHAASRGFAPPPDAAWQRANLPPALGSGPDALVCHNDLCVENVVVDGGRAVGVIDFDFAAPSEALLDIAIAARHWVPIRDPRDLPPAWADLDLRRRFEAVCEVHELDAARRSRVLDHVADFLDRALHSMRSRAEQGRPGYLAAWTAGYPEQNRRSRAAVGLFR